MKKTAFTIAATVAILAMGISSSSCVNDNDYASTSPRDNFEALWTIMDEHYCFFDVKQKQLGADWDAIHDKYVQYITEDMSQSALFEVMWDMLDELQDGHVNLSGPLESSRSWQWKDNYPRNFSEDIQRNYLGNDYSIASNGYYYKILPQNVGYLYIESFSNGISESRLDVILSRLQICNGLIIDVRENGGGDLTTAEQVAARFTNSRTITGYYRYKTGKGHNDLSDYIERYIDAASTHLRWQKPTVVLANRGCYSATNQFVSDMKCFNNITVFGDRTGGGGGLPFSAELPNGWVIRFSAAPAYDVDEKEIETGVAPNIVVSQTDVDRARGKDTLIEAAIGWINAL